jgi:ABC-type Fe3+/spermidine/putrescine transport system ATPase subunit
LTALRLKDLSKHFGVTVALSAVTLEVAQGEVLGVLGPSGCGKTTLLRCLAGFERPTSGEIWLDDSLVASTTENRPPERRDVGMVFQSYALWPHMTVGENVSMPLRLRKTAKKDRDARVADVLDRLGLTTLIKRYPSELSGGQQQRVALARATVVQPRLLLLDEPLSNLDAQLRTKLRDELREDLKKFAITTVFVTHDQAEAMVICDRVAVLSAGSLVETGPPRDLYENPRNLFTGTFLGRANVFDGTVVSHTRGTAIVETSEGLRLSGVARGHPTVGGTVKVLIRPEHLSLGQGEAGDNHFQGRLRSSLFLGNRIDLVVDTERLALRIEISGGAPHLEEGSAMGLSAPAARTFFFDA